MIENEINNEAIIPGKGQFIIADSKSEIVEMTNKEDVLVGRSILKSGEMTDFDGFFNAGECEYVGYLSKPEKSPTKVLLFYLGDNADLFEHKHYFQVIQLISEKRIFIMFHDAAGRDFNFIKDKWDWERKSSKIKDCEIIGTEPEEKKYERN